MKENLNIKLFLFIFFTNLNLFLFFFCLFFQSFNGEVYDINNNQYNFRNEKYIWSEDNEEVLKSKYSQFEWCLLKVYSNKTKEEINPQLCDDFLFSSSNTNKNTNTNSDSNNSFSTQKQFFLSNPDTLELMSEYPACTIGSIKYGSLSNTKSQQNDYCIARGMNDRKSFLSSWKCNIYHFTFFFILFNIPI